MASTLCNPLWPHPCTARLVKLVNTVDLKSALKKSYRFKSDSEQTHLPLSYPIGFAKKASLAQIG